MTFPCKITRVPCHALAPYMKYAVASFFGGLVFGLLFWFRTLSVGRPRFFPFSSVFPRVSAFFCVDFRLLPFISVHEKDAV